MATPYFQLRYDTVPSTQNVARDSLEDLPILVLARSQTEGRGRTGKHWQNAEQAVAASLAIRLDESDLRPFSLMAGVAATRATEETFLKWPNDLLFSEAKVGGILVERSSGVVVIGFGLNLWWPNAPSGMGALYRDDPGDDRYAEIGALWAAELMRIVEGDGWPIDEYRSRCVTIGSDISWDPAGAGRGIDISKDGGLIVDHDGLVETIYSGEIRHLRHG